jgi:hypothetical protein
VDTLFHLDERRGKRFDVRLVLIQDIKRDSLRTFGADAWEAP